MADIYTRRVARVCPPRDQANAGGAPGAMLVLSVTSTSATKQLNTTILQRPALANQSGRPGSFGKCLLRLQAENNDVWYSFSKAANVTVSSATTSGSGMGMHLPANQDRDYEVDGAVDLYLNYVTLNGASNTANLRVQIVSFDEVTDGYSPNP